MILSIYKLGVVLAALSSLAVAAPADEIYAIEKRAVSPKTTDTTFQTAALTQFNHHRKMHGSPNLVWNTTLANYAQKAADKCKFAHTGGPYGENIYAVFPGTSNYYTETKTAIFDWANEINQYKFNDPGPESNLKCLHATALLWRATKHVGCAWRACSNLKGAVFFCEFNDAVPNFGFPDDYKKNVFPYGTKVPS